MKDLLGISSQNDRAVFITLHVAISFGQTPSVLTTQSHDSDQAGPFGGTGPAAFTAARNNTLLRFEKFTKIYLDKPWHRRARAAKSSRGYTISSPSSTCSSQKSPVSARAAGNAEVTRSRSDTLSKPKSNPSSWRGVLTLTE